MRRFDRHTEVHVTMHRDGASTRVSVSGEVDFTSAAVIDDQLRAVEDDLADGNALIVDLSGVAFMDVAGARVLAEAAERAAQQAWQLCLVKPSAQVRRLFDLLGTERSLPVLVEPENASAD